MWERISESGLLIAGAIILFLAMTVILFLLERREEKREKKVLRPQPLRVYRDIRTDRAA